MTIPAEQPGSGEVVEVEPLQGEENGADVEDGKIPSKSVKFDHSVKGESGDVEASTVNRARQSSMFNSLFRRQDAAQRKYELSLRHQELLESLGHDENDKISKNLWLLRIRAYYVNIVCDFPWIRRVTLMIAYAVFVAVVSISKYGWRLFGWPLRIARPLSNFFLLVMYLELPKKQFRFSITN